MPSTRHIQSTVPGVLLRALGSGVLIQGESGSGKSELALGMLDRGHRLVADDAVELRVEPDGRVFGHCPQALRGLLEVRGLGIIDVAALFGPDALTPSTEVDIVIRLLFPDPDDWNRWPRLHGRWQQQALLGRPRPCLLLPGAPGRSMPLLLETAVRQWQQRQTAHSEGAESDA